MEHAYVLVTCTVLQTTPLAGLSRTVYGVCHLDFIGFTMSHFKGHLYCKAPLQPGKLSF